MKSVQDILTATTAYFERNRIESPRLNAEHLLAHVLGKRRIDLYLEFDRPLGETDLEPLRPLVKRRAAGEPLQHLLGTVDFHGRIFLSDPRALVPRPETEHLVEQLLALPVKPARTLDVGTGTGVIALTLAAEWPDALIHAVDISPDALALATENTARLALTERVVLHQSDLLADVHGIFDLIVANLPYIPSADIAALSREVRHDPLLALDGGPDGLQPIVTLLEQTPTRLAPGGTIALEIGAGQSASLMEHLRALGYFNVRATADYSGITRFIFATFG